MAKSPYADLPEPLKTHLPGLFESYPRLNATTPSSLFVWNNAGGSIVRNLAICHACISDMGTGWDDMITAVPKSDELSLEYLRMLIRGPFRSLADLIKLDKVDGNYYLHLMSLEKWPASVLMNFCIASRIPIEFNFLLPAWAKRCEAGFNPTLAWLLTYSFGVVYGENAQHTDRTFRHARPGHMWLDAASSWRNILDGTFQSVARPYKTHPTDVTPTNSIWGTSPDYNKLRLMMDNEIADFYQTPIRVLEPPPSPVIKPPKNKNPYVILPEGGLMHWGNNHALPAAQPGGLVVAAEDIAFIYNQWIAPGAPQPQPIEVDNEVEDGDEWDGDDNDDLADIGPQLDD